MVVNLWLTLLAILLTVYVLYIFRMVRRGREAKARQLREHAEAQRSGLLRDLRLAPLATGYSLEKPPSEHFAEQLEAYHRAELGASKTEATVTPLMLAIVLLSLSFLLLVVGLSQVTVAGSLLLGVAIFSAYFPAARLYRLRDRVAAARLAAADVMTYLDRNPGVLQVEDAQPLDRLRDAIKLDKVTIANRHGQRLLNNVSLTIPAGKTVAIVASDPQTPLALAGLFVRFYDPAAGRVLYDDRDICQATLDTVRGQAVLVVAEGPLFPGSITENIICGNSGFTSLQVSDALKHAQAADFVRSLPQGVQTPITGQNSQLKADQAFRIGLARSLLREPSVLIIQEPEGDFDGTVSSQLDTALRQAADGRTLIVLPSRLATLRSSQHIYLFHEGKLHAEGTHSELLQNSDLYRHLNYVRFNPFRGTVRC
jgi:ABC-type multidrug transport system fused ATPase/permease subunit